MKANNIKFIKFLIERPKSNIREIMVNINNTPEDAEYELNIAKLFRKYK